MNRELAPIKAHKYAASSASVTTTLRAALGGCGKSRYSVSKATGIPESTVSNFVAGGTPSRGENIRKLAGDLGLVLALNSEETGEER